MDPVLITKVGLDIPGKKIIELLEFNNMSTEFFQMDDSLPTGKVTATIDGLKEISYEITRSVAWDNITWDPGFEKLVAESKYFIFGTLAARSRVSSDTLFRLLEIAPFKVLDINLRSPHFNRSTVEDLLQKTDMLKLNLSELELITGWFTKHPSEADRIQALQDKFNLRDIIVTKGANGSTMYLNGHVYTQPGLSIQVTDTVGSGDAFLAGLIFKFIYSTSIEEALVFANAVGALIATLPGGCPEYKVSDIGEINSNNNNDNNNLILPAIQ